MRIRHRSDPNHDDERRICGQRTAPIVANRTLDFEAGVDEQQLKFARKKHVTREVIYVALDGAAVLVLLVEEANLGQLLIAQVARGLAANQAGAVAFIRAVEIDCERRARRRS